MSNAYQTGSNHNTDPNSPRTKTLQTLTISDDHSFLLVLPLLSVVTVNYVVKFDEQIGLGSFVMIVQLVSLLGKASEARVNRRLRRYYLIVLLLPNISTLACLLLSSI